MAVWQADAVFVGTVIDRVEEPVGGSMTWTVYNVSVNQRLHGQVGSSVITVGGYRPSAEEIEASKSAAGPSHVISSCDYDFTLGRQYIIYAHKTADGRYTTSACSGTKPLQAASEDLDYIAGLSGAEPTGRVYGRIDRMVVDSAKPDLYQTVPASGVTVALTSTSSRLTATTDSEGKLDVRVPPGNYTIAPVVPETVRVYGNLSPASVPARGCAPVYFSLIANGRIEGRVVRADGTPASDASVDVVPADLPPGEPPPNSTVSPSRHTDKDGRFSIDAILPGRYVIAVNVRFGPRLSAPYLTTYFPHGARQDARIVEIGEGERKTGFRILVNPLRETTISGTVVLDDDRPVAEASVFANAVDHRDMIVASSKTDSSGAFELRLLAGVTYRIRAGVRTDNTFRPTETVVFVGERLVGLRLRIAR
jgi:hypothetical protein